MSIQTKVMIAIVVLMLVAGVIVVLPTMVNVFNATFVPGTVESCETFQDDFGVKVEVYREFGANYGRKFYLTENAGVAWVMSYDQFDDNPAIRGNCSRVQFIRDGVAIMPLYPDSHSSFLVFASTSDAIAGIVDARLTDYVYDCTAVEITSTSFTLNCLSDRPEPTAYTLRFKTEAGRVWHGGGD